MKLKILEEKEMRIKNKRERKEENKKRLKAS